MLDPEIHAKISKANKGNQNGAVPLLAEGIRFNSRIEAAKALGVSVGTITFRIKTKKPGYKKLLFEND